MPSVCQLGREFTSMQVQEGKEEETEEEEESPYLVAGTWHNEVYISPRHGPATFFTR